MKKIEILVKHFLTDVDFCKQYNQSFSSATQVFSERVAVEIFGFKLGAKKGYSFDSDQNDELKSCTYLQPKICQKCNATNNFLSEMCDCGSTNFTYNKGDSRWGINAASHIKYLSSLNRYMLFLVECIDIKNEIFSLRGWFIDKNNEHFNYILLNQSNAERSKSLNFLPYSHDFFMSKPRLFLDMEFSKEKLNIIFCDTENPKDFLVKKEHFLKNQILTKADYYVVLDALKIKYKKNSKIDEIINLLFENNSEIDISQYISKKRVKNLNKDRGVTTRGM